MPVNKKYPVAELAAAAEYYVEKKGRMITLEYILIAGVNDGLDQIKPLAALARRLSAKVNLIYRTTKWKACLGNDPRSRRRRSFWRRSKRRKCRRHRGARRGTTSTRLAGNCV